MSDKIKNKKGVSIYFALIIMVIFLAMSFGLTEILMSLKKTIRGMGDSVNALAAADAGAEKLFYLEKECRKLGCDDLLCKWPDCTGLDNGYHLDGSLSNGATYEVDIIRNCGFITASSTGTYKETKRKIETSLGHSAAGVYLNSARNKTCKEICTAFDCECYSVGTDIEGSGGNYFGSNPSDCNLDQPGTCFIAMNASDPPWFCGGHQIAWTNCNCTSTTP